VWIGHIDLRAVRMRILPYSNMCLMSTASQTSVVYRVETVYKASEKKKQISVRCAGNRGTIPVHPDTSGSDNRFENGARLPRSAENLRIQCR